MRVSVRVKVHASVNVTQIRQGKRGEKGEKKVRNGGGRMTMQVDSA